MEFELTPELIDQIIFGMENQDSTYYVDAVESTVIAGNDRVADSEVEERYHEIPAWTSVNGFQLMEKFVAVLRNPMAREALRESLAGGRGVFAGNFKNALHQYPDVEKLWFTFKDREMRRYVVEWYNEISDIWGIAKIALHEDETEELILSDFIISSAQDSAELRAIIVDVDKISYSEIYTGFPESWIEDRYRRDRAGMDSGEDVILCAETPAGELAGLLMANEHEFVDDDETVMFGTILQLYVIPEYRGLGVSKTLLIEYCAHAYDRGIARISISCPAAAMGYGERIEREGFIEISRVYELDVDHWKRENTGG